MAHERVVCSQCKAVIRQCRCIAGAHNVTYEVCNKCKIKMFDAAAFAFREKVVALREAYKAVGFETADDPYQNQGFLVVRPERAKGHMVVFVAPGHSPDLVFLAFGGSLNTGTAFPKLTALELVTEFVQEE